MDTSHSFHEPTKGLSRLHSATDITGCYRLTPEDFSVSEQLGFELAGEGPHHWLYIYKRNLNTMDVVQALADKLGVGIRDIGYSGLKDKKAVTSQWFSVSSELIQPEVFTSLIDEYYNDEIEDISVTDDGLWWISKSVKHNKKLKIGTHKSNRFVLRLLVTKGDGDAENSSSVELGSISGLGNQLECIRDKGFLNYFMEQRFGRDNLERFCQKPNLQLKRKSDQMLLSAARSYFFNLAVSSANSNRSLFDSKIDDKCQLVGSNSFFTVSEDDVASVSERLKVNDVAVAFPMPGKDVINDFAVDLEHSMQRDMLNKIARYAAKSSYRAAVCRPENMQWSIGEAKDLDQGANENINSNINRNAITLEFSLQKGSYATAVLREIGEFYQTIETATASDAANNY